MALFRGQAYYGRSARTRQVALQMAALISVAAWSVIYAGVQTCPKPAALATAEAASSARLPAITT